MKKFYSQILTVILFFFMTVRAESAITSITLTPATPTTVSTGLAYYLAAKTYTFTVNVIDPAATGWGSVSDVRISINNTTNIVVAVAPTGTGAHTTTVNSGNVTSSANITGTYNNLTVTFTVNFRWNTIASTWSGGRLIRASATSSNTMNSDRSVSYGICSSLKVLNIAMTGEASDGMICRWHNTFNVNGGAIVYDFTGATASDAVSSLADLGASEITGTTLYIGAVSAGTDGDETDGQSIAIVSDFLATNGFTSSTTPVAATFVVSLSTGGTTETSTTSTSLLINRVQVTNIIFSAGGGIDSPPAGYYRSTNISGTRVTITASMQGGGGAMNGNTYFELRDTTDNSITTVIIANGQTTGTANLTYPTTLGANSTETRAYEIYNVYGGAYGSPAGYGQYMSNPALSTTRITQSSFTARAINWDNADHPGANSHTFTAFISHSTTAGSLTVNWTPLTAGFPDGDFLQYKFYYKQSTDTAWKIVDSSTTGYTNLATITTGTITINGLAPLTNYDYMVSAIDIFGNEVTGDISAPATAHKITATNVATAPSSITITMTDGITSYNDASFNGNPNPAVAHRLRKANIRVDAEVITSGNTASKVEIVIADNASDLPAQWGSTGTSNDMRTLLSTTGATYTFPTIKTSPNIWTGYIPSENALMTEGRSIRMLLKLTYQSGVVYVDHDSESESPPGNPTDQEWRFYVYFEPKFTPWPVKILNNVITDKDPVAYPSYYLTDDALVTIQVYDIKGRVVSTLLDGAYRKAGQNIKEQGWRGTNKYSKKLGVGLYYIHVKAKRTTDGKVILDTFKKVVMSR